MTGRIETLLRVASPALGPSTARREAEAGLAAWGSSAVELGRLLAVRNGFYAFVSSLHVFPWNAGEPVMDLQRWNAPTLWRQEYGDLADGSLFFAEDVFGGQFCIDGGSVFVFDPETGRRKLLSDTLEGWAEKMLSEHDVLCGSGLAQLWQERHGALPPGKRLAPKMPFVAGGEFELSNLYQADAVDGMRFRGHLATQIRDLPDGAKIRFEVTEP